MATDDKPSLAELNKKGAAAGYYNAGTTEREPYLERARDVAELTVPTLFREQGANGSSKIIIPWNSFGAYCVSNLASKVVFALFPPGRPNFKADQSAKTRQDLAQLPPEQRIPVEQVIRIGFSRMEQEVAAAIEEDGDRAKMTIAALRLIIGGNHGLQFYDDGTIRGIPLERFICTRDPQGNLLEFAVEDQLDWSTLSEPVRLQLQQEGIAEPERPADGRRPVKVYTHGLLAFKPPFRDKVWEVRQEVFGIAVADTGATYTQDALPYLFLPWMLLDGEHYGRSYCEFYEGDLLTVEGLTKTIGEAAQAMARFLTVISPVGLTDKKVFAKAQNGDVISGREEDIHVHTATGKSADLSVAKADKDDAIQRLSKAFLLNSSIQRGGERVTAEEIRYAAQELEDALGGVYSQQVITWQGPYIKRKVFYLQKNQRTTPLPKQAYKLTVTAGLAALARNAELEALRQSASIVTETYGPSETPKYIKPAEFVSRVMASLGVNPEGLVPSQEELDAAAQNDQMMAMAQQMGPEALKQVGNNVTSNQVADTNAQAKMATAAPASAETPTE